ncbi:protein tyrosine phosphatase family protein [Alteromonas sp. CYL-A6]|uniref:protein tyrosine phosphatase family protein n=1 Tax=Alteromonas nitratireducens TaxID=3390813 RepID=UPI0034B91549
MKRYTLFALFATLFTLGVRANTDIPEALTSLKNFQQNTPELVSSGLPDASHFAALKAMGVTRVIDLIPGDRSDEQAVVSGLGLTYHNVPVIWENPTVGNFRQYVSYMQQDGAAPGKTLTHCKLNWRGAVFTYLYRVTELGQSDAEAKQDLLSVWTPNDTWQAFIDKVKADAGVSD